MKATEANFLAFLKKSSQFVIPIYQRTYSWTFKECRQLWDDVLRAGTEAGNRRTSNPECRRGGSPRLPFASPIWTGT